jgi:hypothetical protein
MAAGVDATLKGSVGGGVVDVVLGSGLGMTAGVLAVDATALAFLPLSGGALTGDVSQVVAPTAPQHLANKEYVDSNFQTKQPVAMPDHLGIFGLGSNQGQIIDSGYTIDVNINNEPNNLTLWPSSRISSHCLFGLEIWKSTAPISIAGLSNVNAFSTGNAKVGPSTWNDLNFTIDMTAGGVVSVYNPLSTQTYFKIVFTSNSLVSSNNTFGSILCQFKNESTSQMFGVIKTLKVLNHPNADFCGSVYLPALVSIAPRSSFKFSVTLTNEDTSPAILTVDPAASMYDPSILIVERHV